jgi:DNA-binding XRE family transcriptional regulator
MEGIEMTKIEAADVQAIRKLTGKDQAAFGRALGVSPRTIRGWEKGALIPESQQLTLGAARAALIGGEALRQWARDLARNLRDPATV